MKVHRFEFAGLQRRLRQHAWACQRLSRCSCRLSLLLRCLARRSWRSWSAVEQVDDVTKVRTARLEIGLHLRWLALARFDGHRALQGAPGQSSLGVSDAIDAVREVQLPAQIVRWRDRERYGGERPEQRHVRASDYEIRNDAMQA